MKSLKNPHQSNLIFYFLCTVVIFGFVGLRATHTYNLPYTISENWSVLGNVQIHPNELYAVDYLPLKIWIRLLGDSAVITRYLSVLFTLLGFAFVFRLCRDLWDARVAWTAVLLLGTVSVASNLVWMAQPYAALIMIVPAQLVIGLRYVLRPTPSRAVFYGVVVVASAYICTFSILLTFAQVLWFLVFVRHGWRDRKTWIAFAAITLSVLPRLLPQFQSELSFSSWLAVDLSKMPISIQPLEFIQLLLLLALATLAPTYAHQSTINNTFHRRYTKDWRSIYLLSIAVIYVALVGLLSVGSLYSIGVLPILAILGAMGLWGLARFARVISLIIFVALGLITFRDPIPGVPYLKIVEQSLSANFDDKLVVAAPYIWQHLPFAHFAADRSFHIFPENSNPILSLLPAEKMSSTSDVDTNQRLNLFINNAPQVWLYAENVPDDQLSKFSDSMAHHYDEVSANQRFWFPNQSVRYGDLRKFIRIPDNTSVMFAFGNQLTLRAWSLQQSVQVIPCERITLQSWWAATSSMSGNLSMTLVMTNSKDGQGIAHSDGSPTGRDSLTLKPDIIHVDERSIQVPCDVQPGEYPLLIGVYEFQDQSIHQLPASLPDGAVLGDFAYLTTLFVNE